MISALNWPTYNNYKQSGEYWMEQIPAHWETRKLKHLFREKRHRPNLTLNCGAISFGEVVEKDDDLVPVATKASYQEVLAGEFLVNPLNLNYDLKSLRIGLSEINVVVSAGYIVLQAMDDLDKRYFKYLLHRYDVACMKLLGSGVRQTISFNHIANSILVAPPIPEQRAIAAFLDEKCAKVDEAIRIKEEQIALLRERRQILIQEAVTRGLNSVAPMKDSGIDWIGKIPAHWHVKRIRNVSKSVSTGRTPPSSAAVDYFERGTIPWYTPSDVLECGEFDLSSKSINHSAVNHGHVDLYPANSVYFIGIGGTLGKANLSNKVASCNQQFNVIVPSEAVFPNWILNWLNSYRDVIFAMTDFTTIPIINQANTKSIAIAVPPRHEQSAILSHLSAGRDKIGVAISVKAEQINALREYKTTLINAAVTGKIKVA